MRTKVGYPINKKRDTTDYKSLFYAVCFLSGVYVATIVYLLYRFTQIGGRL